MAANKTKKLIKNLSLNFLWLIIYCIFFAVVESWLQGIAIQYNDPFNENPWIDTARSLFDAVNSNYPVFLGLPIVLGWVIISVKVWFPKVILTKQVKPDLSNADELKKYADLRDQGIITEEEFQAKKKKLLDL